MNNPRSGGNRRNRCQLTRSGAVHLAVLVVVCLLGLTAGAARGATVAYWKFDVGALTLDSSGNGHTLTNVGVTSGLPAPGGGSGSASFDGSHSIFSTETTLDLSSLSALTVEWWANPASFANTTVMWEHSANFNSNPGGVISYQEPSFGGLVYGAQSTYTSYYR